MNDKLTQIMQEVARLAAETAEASSRGDMEAVARLQLETETAWQRARRLGQQRASRPAVGKNPSARDRVVSALTELNVPSSPKLIAAYCEARSGDTFDQRAMASIRRDERRSWESGSRRDTYVLPTLEGPWFTAGRGRFVLSHWPLWQRIVGPLSPRVDHLKVCLCIVNQCEAWAADPGRADRMCALLGELARTVPDALANAWDSREELNIERIRKAVLAELSLIEAEDEKWRQKEAERAVRSLNDDDQLWGGNVPHVIANKAR